MTTINPEARRGQPSNGATNLREDPLTAYENVSVSIYASGLVQLRHVRMDVATNRLISDDLGPAGVEYTCAHATAHYLVRAAERVEDRRTQDLTLF